MTFPMPAPGAPSGKLALGYRRICECPDSHLNCMSPKEWLKAQLGVWEFYYEARDIRNKSIHPATFPIALSSRCIELFTHRGELVLDPFVGSGTTLISARDLDRNAVGFDLKPEYVELAQQRLNQQPCSENTLQLALCDDARNIPRYLDESTVALILTSPPYANLLNRPRKNKSRRGDRRANEQLGRIEQYSQDPRDLGTLEPERFRLALCEIFSSLFPLLRPQGHCVVNIPDMWWEDKRIPLHITVVEALQSVGYELRNVIIWDRRNIVNRIGIFGWPSNYIAMGVTFEYILDFWRPKD